MSPPSPSPTPDLIKYFDNFDNFAFDEVLRYGNLDTRTRLMVQLAALIAGQDLGEYKVMLGAALTVGVTPVQAKEIAYQAVPYMGMGKVFDFLHATNETLTTRGIALPLAGQSTTTPETREQMGLAVQKQIVGADRIDAMYAAATLATTARRCCPSPPNCCLSSGTRAPSTPSG